jgi:hypothetical protein
VDEGALAELEERTRHAVAGSLRAALVALEREVTTIYIAAAGDTRHALDPFAQDTIRKRLTDALGGLIGYDYADTRHVLISAARAALSGGADDIDEDLPGRAGQLPLDLRQALPDLTRDMRADLGEALKLAKHGGLRRYGDVQAVVGMARKALNRADLAAVFVVHRAHNEGRARGIARAARNIQISMLWRAERDACVACLGYAGALAVVGDSFAPVVDVADASQRPAGPVWGPPLHPNCRCQLEPWTGPTTDLDAVDLPMALRREAQRSIASGAAVGSEPNRLRAADRLLDVADLLIPKTVQRRARKAIDAGTFES